jgi:Chaperone of endosialidase
MNRLRLLRAITLLSAIRMLNAQPSPDHDPTALKHWTAPLYWQPPASKNTPQLPPIPLSTIASPLALVAITPCRLVDTRASQGFPPALGPPSLLAGVARTFPLQSSADCFISAAAQAYSLNITVVPSSPSGFLTGYPTGQSLPLAAVLVWAQGNVTSNAAVIAAGASGSVDLYANEPTDVIIDINGYYTAPGYVSTGSDNTALGDGALFFNASGSYNTAIGQGALTSNSTGADNTAVGRLALNPNTTGNMNTALGSGALLANTDGANNSAVGFHALAANIHGGYNAALGWGALASNTTGGTNVAIGWDALDSNTVGNGNIAIGPGAAQYVTTGDNNIEIGNLGSSSDNRVIRIGDLVTQTSFFAGGIRGVTTGNNDAVPVVIDSSGQLGTVNSSQRFKEDVQDMGDRSRAILELRPVTFRYRKPFDDGSKPVQYGLIAEEVAKVFPDLVARSADGQIESVKYQVLDSLLLNELKRQQAAIRDLEERITQLESKLR